jgi:hypothetical protein
VILDTEGNIFGGCTPVEWESRTYNPDVYGQNCLKADDSLRSFLFTLKNPHNIPARGFALKAGKKHRAIACNSEWGACFEDIYVYDNCNAKTINSTYNFGNVYTNDTGLDGEIVFTGSVKFQVKEIEVFKITG